MEVKSKDPSLLTSTFFGLTPKEAAEIRVNIFKQIHEIVFHGNGGYDYHTVYNMPIWLRKFTFKELEKFYSEQEKAFKNQSKSKGQTSLINEDGTVNTPAFTKASQPYKGQSSYK